VACRLAFRHPRRSRRFHAIVFGAGDYRQRAEIVAAPLLQPGDRPALGPLSARIEALLATPGSSRSDFEGAGLRSGPAWHARQADSVRACADALALWDVWTPIAGPARRLRAAFRRLALDWRSLGAMRAVALSRDAHPCRRISSTADPALDNLVPSTSLLRSPRRPPRRSARREPTAAV